MKKPETKTIVTIFTGIFVLYLAIHFWPSVASVLGKILSACAPLFIGIILAYIIDMPMSFLEKHWFPKSRKKIVLATRRPLCLILSLLAVFAVLALVIGLVLPQLISCIRLILQKIPDGIRMGIELLDRAHLLSQDVISVLESVDWQSRVDQILDVVTNGVTGVVGVVFAAVTEVVSGIVTGVISFIFAIYILLSKGKLKEQLRRLSHHYLPEKISRSGEHVLGIMNESFRGYIVGQSLEAVILGSLCALGMLILNIPYAAMIGTLIAFTSLIPVAGAYIGGGVSALMILSVDPVKALVFLIFLVILQQIEGNLIYPKVVGSSLKLPGIWVLAAVTVGGGIAGVAGMLLGVPLVASVYRLIGEDMKIREKAEKEKAPFSEETKEDAQKQ